MKLAAAFGRFALTLCAMAFITGAALFVVGGFLITWPLMRMSPTARRKQALMNFAVSAFALAQVLGGDDDPEKVAPKS